MQQINEYHKSNLIKLADYLESLPDNYDRFTMCYYAFKSSKYSTNYLIMPTITAKEIPCGTVACAVGHGPSAGIKIPFRMMDRYQSISDDLNTTDIDIGCFWTDYSVEVFGFSKYSEEWYWCFSDLWHKSDDTPKGAAKRIRHVLTHGVPDKFNKEYMSSYKKKLYE